MKKKFSKWFFKYWIHILVWALFIFYETIMVGLIFGVYGNFITYLLHYGINICFFYLNAIIIFPSLKLKVKGKVLKLLLILILDISGFILINYMIDSFLINKNIVEHTGKFELDKQYALRTLYRCVYFMGFSIGYFFLLNYVTERKKSTDLENQRLKDIISSNKMAMELSNAENSFLKAQINPHFLFNTLDYIYHNIYSNAENAAEAIIVLSEIMRYSIHAVEDDGFVTLGDEIEQVQNLLSLYKLRQPGPLNFKIIFTNEVVILRFIPLVLVTLLENIFKHGNLSDLSKNAFMKISIENEMLMIQTVNPYNHSSRKSGTKKGLKNITNRLIYSFGNSVLFNHSNEDEMFYKVDINIPLHLIN